MIECKEDVVVWFRQLESYKRIDAMCTLLTSCLSFELRFLGTYLEDLASRDYEGLRSIELRVSNAPDLIQNLATCQQAVPTDQRVRRMMAMYLALIRNVNRKCCNELYKTLELWGRRDCMDKYVDQDELFVQELLLIYIMAKNHPVLAFEQRLKCAEIFQMLYEQMVVVIEGGGGGGGGGDSTTTASQQQQQMGNECPSGSSSSPSPTMQQIHLQQQSQHSQGQPTTATINYQQQQQPQPPLTAHHHVGHHQQLQMAHHQQQQQQHLQQQHHPQHVHQQFLDSSPTQQQQQLATHPIYGQQQHPQLIQTTTHAGQQQQQAHIQAHPGHQLVAAYPQLIQTVDGLSQVQQAPQQQQQQQQQTQPMSISMDQFQAVAAVPQYLENHPFLTAAGTTVTASGQNMVQWPAAYRHATPQIDTSIPPPQIPILPQSSTSSSSSQIISQSSSPTQSRTTSPVRGGGGAGGGTANSGSSNSKIASKRASRRLSTDQTTPPPQGVEMMVNKTYEENPEILRNGYGRQATQSVGGGGRLGKTYSMHHHQQQQQQQQQYQTAHHLSNFQVHPQYNFINHQLAHHQQQQHLQQQQQQQHTIIPGLTPHGLEYVTYTKTGAHPSTLVSMLPAGGTVMAAGQQTMSTSSIGGGAGSDSGSNSNDDCSPSETPTMTLPGGLVMGPPTSALQSRLLNTQLKGGSSSGGGGGRGESQVIYVNSSNVSPNNNSSSGNQQMNNSASGSSSNSLAISASNSGNSNELAAPPSVASSPSPVSVVSVVNPYVKGRYPQQQQQMTIHGELIGQEMTLQGGGDPQPVYAYNNHFVTHHPHHAHHHVPQQAHSHHMMRTTGAPVGAMQPQQIQSPPPPSVTGVVVSQQQQQTHIPPGMTIIPTQQLSYSVLTGPVGHPQQQQQQQTGYVVTTTSTPPTVVALAPLNSCYNCGSQAHSGLECRETSMEDAIHHSNYKLDYKTQAGQEGIVEEEEEDDDDDEEVELRDGGDGRQVETDNRGPAEGHRGTTIKTEVLLTKETDMERRRRRLNEQEIIDVDALDDDDDEDEETQTVSTAVEVVSSSSASSRSKRIGESLMEGGVELTHRFNAMALQQGGGGGGGGSSGSGGGADHEATGAVTYNRAGKF